MTQSTRSAGSKMVASNELTMSSPMSPHFGEVHSCDCGLARACLGAVWDANFTLPMGCLHQVGQGAIDDQRPGFDKPGQHPRRPSSFLPLRAYPRFI